MNATFDDFMKLDIRIGTIKEVGIVPDADKLLKLMVDCGEDSLKQIVSGIREFYEDPQELVGIQCAFVVNLEPRTIRGFESQGMILGVGEDSFSPLIPVGPIAPGAKVQ